MVHLIRSLLTNMNSMIATETKYLELCKYTVTYVGLNFLQRSSAVADRGRATHVDPKFYVSPGDAWFDGPAVLYYGLVLVDWCVRKWGVAPFAPKFRMERVSPYCTNHFWRGQ